MMNNQIEKYFRLFFKLNTDDEITTRQTPEGYDVSIRYAEPTEYYFYTLTVHDKTEDLEHEK